MPPSPDPIATFIARWQGAEAAERANYVLFLVELCAILGVDPPDPAAGRTGPYRLERGVTRREDDGTSSSRFIDLYRRDCFVLEAKQGANPTQQVLFADHEADRRANIRRSKGWAQHMNAAKGQAERYIRDLPIDEPNPPFLIVADIGFCFDIYADFTGTFRQYTHFPDGNSFRIYLPDLANPEIRARLRAIWLDPQSLDPARQRIGVTRDIAGFLAKLAKALEGPATARHHAPQHVATFLMRCIFCMFAQSVGLLPPDSFSKLLEDSRNNLAGFVPRLGELWRAMNAGGYSVALAATIRKFNGGLFAPGAHGGADPLPVDADMLNLLISAARRDWQHVEPAIFGTLLENALDTAQRSELGAHFTPRAFVERLVLPTVMEPLRAEWDGVKSAAYDAETAGDRPRAAAIVRAFHARLCAIRVLDPACGTGNFLYVTMELMKRLEGEIIDLLANLDPGEGDRLDLAVAAVDPHQFLGLEKNPRAVPVAELVLWIGWLQWHFRTRGNAPPAEPILRDFHNIAEADALLTYSRTEPERDAFGALVTRWGGRMMLHPITGEPTPDPTDRVALERPVDPKPTRWPEADFIVGNPPFIAGKDLRAELGSGYAEALWLAYPDVPKSADLAMHFWWKAAQAVKGIRPRGRPKRAPNAPPQATARPQTLRFGLITSNSIRQVFCRRVVADALEGKPPLHLVFAVPDHPWTDGAGSAAVRIAMTVVAAQSPAGGGVRLESVNEIDGPDGVPDIEFSSTSGRINSNLTIGPDVKSARPLLANARIGWDGVKLHGSGFVVTPGQARSLGLGKIAGLGSYIRPYMNGRDLTQTLRGVMVIDLFGLSEDELRSRFPAVYQHLLLYVKPERDLNNRASYRENWWLFGEPRRDLRPALVGLERYIATVDTAKHRVFSFLNSDILVDDKIVIIASSDAYCLGVLQSNIHVAWMLAQDVRLEDRPVYAKTQCFDPFPFPPPERTHRRDRRGTRRPPQSPPRRAPAPHPHHALQRAR